MRRPRRGGWRGLTVRRRARWAPTARGEVARGGGSACKAGVAGEVARTKRRAAAAQCARPRWQAAAQVRRMGRCIDHCLLPRGANAFPDVRSVAPYPVRLPDHCSIRNPTYGDGVRRCSKIFAPRTLICWSRRISRMPLPTV
jgi:hypothetical protein